MDWIYFVNNTPTRNKTSFFCNICFFDCWFFEYKTKICKLRTYERGVENETLSCGTGAIATAIALNYSDIDDSNEIKISMKGGDLSISFDRIGEDFSNIWLSGEANEVYKGEINGNIKK